MGQEVYLRKLDIGVKIGGYLAEIRATLTNGCHSNLFKKMGTKLLKRTSIDLGPDPKISKLAIKCYNATSGIRFYDQNQKQVGCWEESDYKWHEQEIPDGHHVIGIYGRFIMNNNNIFNFGFITIKYDE